MPVTKTDIIAALKKNMLALQGFKPAVKNNVLDTALGPIKNAFPNASFPTAAIHEFISITPEDTAATGGFISGLLAVLMQKKGVAIWASASRNIFPPALSAFGISPDRVIFVDLQKEKQILWAVEEALKCKGISAVVGEMQELNFTDSRRLQLATEKSKVPGFILRRNPKQINTTACVTRWYISSVRSELKDGIPGVGFPKWKVSLCKVRNGITGEWEIEFATGEFRHLKNIPAIPITIQKKEAV